jgi:hypothetical protein
MRPSSRVCEFLFFMVIHLPFIHIFTLIPSIFIVILINTPAEILGDPYAKKSSLPHIGITSHQPVPQAFLATKYWASFAYSIHHLPNI